MHDSLTTVNQWPEGMGKGSEGGREVAKGWGNGDICNRVKNKNKVKKKKALHNGESIFNKFNFRMSHVKYKVERLGLKSRAFRFPDTVPRCLLYISLSAQSTLFEKSAFLHENLLNIILGMHPSNPALLSSKGHNSLVVGFTFPY